MSQQDLEKTVTFLGMNMPAYKMVDFMREHEAHHKGQLWLMAREVGVEPPLLVKFA